MLMLPSMLFQMQKIFPKAMEFFSLSQRGMNAAVLYLAPSKHPACSQLEESALDSIQNEQQQHHRERPPGKWFVFASSWEFEFWNPIFPSCLRLPHHQGIGNLSSERLALSGAAQSSPKGQPCCLNLGDKGHQFGVAESSLVWWEQSKNWILGLQWPQERGCPVNNASNLPAWSEEQTPLHTGCTFHAEWDGRGAWRSQVWSPGEAGLPAQQGPGALSHFQ